MNELECTWLHAQKNEEAVVEVWQLMSFWGLDVNILSEKAKTYGLKGKTYSSVIQAYTTALDNAQNGDLVFVGGSNFTVAEVVGIDNE